MVSNITTSQPANTELLPAAQAFDWPLQAMREENWQEAAQRWAVLRIAFPNHPDTWIQGAIAHIESGNLEQAEALLNQTHIQFPNNPYAGILNAELAIRKNKLEKAEELLHSIQEKHPENAHVWLKSAELAEHLGNYEQAVTCFKEAYQCAPDSPIALIQHAELAMRTEQWEKALICWETLRTNFPNLPEGYQRAAKAARKLGYQKEARQLILTHQYGPDIFEQDHLQEQSTGKRGKHTNLGRLLELIWTKAIFNLRSEEHRNYLSYAWWMLEPMMHMAVYYIVFGLLLQQGGDYFPVFLLTGLVPWMWFMKAVSISSGSILAGQNLMLQVGLPSVVFPLVSILQSTLKEIPVFLLLIGFVWLQGYPPGSHWLALIPVIIVQALLTVAFSCAVAAVIPFVRDLTQLVPTGLTFLMFLSGVFFDYHSISPEWHELFLMNPVAFLLKCYREIFMGGIVPDFITLMWWGIGSGVACLLLMLAYTRLRFIYPRIVLE